MAGVDPLKIIEQQLEYLQARSEKGLLTESEVTTFTAVVKLRVVLKSKALNGTEEDPCSDLSTDELKQLLPLLS